MTKVRPPRAPAPSSRRAGPEQRTGPLPPAVAHVRGDDGEVYRKPFSSLRVDELLRATPWRAIPSYRGQLHYSGLYWCATTGGHVPFESRLERARLLLADFDRATVAVVGQPFALVSTVDGRRERRHVPDFFLLRDGGDEPCVVNVKPAHRLADPAVAAALAWPRRLVEQQGWAWETWAGVDPVMLSNVAFLSAYRRDGLVDAAVADAVADGVADGDTVRAVEHRLARQAPPLLVRPAVLRLLWQQRLRCDLSEPLGGQTVLWRAVA